MVRGVFHRRNKMLMLLALAVVFIYMLFHSPVFSPKNIQHFKQLTEINSRTCCFSTESISPRIISNQTTSANFQQRRRISVELVGSARLGNLMFGHASMLGMADRNGLDPVVSEKNALLISTFDLDTAYETVKSLDWLKCEEKLPSAYDDSLNDKISHSNLSVMLFGYFQSWKYFDHIRKRVTKEFRFKKAFAEKAAKFIQMATEKHFAFSVKNQTFAQSILRIGIHVRRTDMLLSNSVEKGYTVASAEYIQRAMTYLEERLSHGSSILPLRLLYVVVSDDISWCKNYVTSQKYPIEFKHDEPAVDLAILASCNHTIMTVGSFGWWAGYLVNGFTVYYKDFPASGSQIAAIFQAEDYFHPKWIGLS